MNTTTRLCSLLALCACLTSATAQDIDLNGHITDETGAGLTGATVTLVGKALWVTSDAAGNYHIDWASPVVRKSERARGLAPSLRSGRLSYDISRSGSPVRVDIFDLRGRVVATPVRGTMAAGSYDVDIGNSLGASSVSVVRLSVDGEVCVLRYSPLTGRGAVVQSTAASGRASAMSKTAAGPVDEISVSLPGFRTSVVSIGSYTSTVDVQLHRAVRILFFINDGGSTVSKRTCVLHVIDSSRSIAAMRFTNYARYRLPLDGNSDIALFDQTDSMNAVRSATLGAGMSASIPWVLEMGPESKRVYAEITWSDTSRGIDTIYAEADIAPWSVRSIVRNKTMTYTRALSMIEERHDGPSDATAIAWCDSQSQFSITERYVFGKPYVDFSLDIGGDSTFADSFDYWLLVGGYRSASLQVASTSGDSCYRWSETAHRTGALSGLGTGHDTSAVYAYSIDPVSVDGAGNLSEVRRVDVAQDWLPTHYRDTLREQPSSAFARIASMQTSDQMWQGKQFGLVVKLSGREFGEDRLFVSMAPKPVAGSPLPSIQRTVTTEYSFDFYPPGANYVSYSNPESIANGDTVQSTFDVVMDAASVYDGGNAMVTSVELIVARKPASLAWNYWTWRVDTVPPITLDDMLAQPVERIPYDLPRPLQRGVVDIAWRGISTLGWPSGEYLVGVATADQFGNTGLAPMTVLKAGAVVVSNPFVVTVLSGSGGP